MFAFTLKDALNKEAQNKNKETSGNSASKKLHLMIVQDAANVQDSARKVGKLLEKKNLGQLTIEEFVTGRNLRDYLEKIKDDKTIIPDTFILDSGGGGSTLGVSIAKWFDEHRPDAPLPVIHFLSLATGAGLSDAALLKAKDPRIETDFISFEELLDLGISLKGKTLKDKFFKIRPSELKSSTQSFRQLLNDRLDIKLPLDVDVEEFDRYKERYDKELQTALLDGYGAGNVPPSTVIKSWRNYAIDLAKSLKSGLYNTQGDNVETDASFYEGTGFPVKGTAVFSIKDVEEWSPNREDKPILIMQSFDQKIVPLLDTGKLGGIVLCGPYLAAHLALLCEANKVSGVFGLIPPDIDDLSSGFNEMAQSHLSPYFDKPETDINGATIKTGQDIIIGAGENGIAFKIETVNKIQGSLDKQQKANQALPLNVASNLRQLNHCFEGFFSDHKKKYHKIKANADSSENTLLRLASGIGLIRTEQVASSCVHQSKALRDILLNENHRDTYNAYKDLATHAKKGYTSFFIALQKNYPVKIRLFDLSPKELLDQKDQDLFHKRYHSMNIHGGKALETWPQLYREQVRTIFQAFQTTLGWNNGEAPIQIMMPAIRTEEETLRIKKIIEEEAEKENLTKIDYQFGVMIETIDSCDNAADIAKHCDFISFGTNDLTQQVLNIPRDDLRGRKKYKKEHGFDPYKKLAPEVLTRIRDVCAVARKINPKIEIDICGGQAADVDMALTLFDAGIDNLSVAPSQENLIALPLLLNYQMFDKIENRNSCKKTPKTTTINV